MIKLALSIVIDLSIGFPISIFIDCLSGNSIQCNPDLSNLHDPRPERKSGANLQNHLSKGNKFWFEKSAAELHCV